MFEPILRELIDAIPGARGVVFCDPLGESVQACGASGRHAPELIQDFDLRVAGAQLATPLELATLDGAALGANVELTIGGSGETLLVHLLPEGYYLVLCVAPGTLVARARHLLRRSAVLIGAEI